MKNLIIFGGTFDPIHNGHLRIASFAANKLDADVIFLPNSSPRWKNPKCSIKDRVNMIKIAIEKYKNFSIDDYEIIHKNKINYTIDTITYLKEKYQNYNLYFLIGEDQVNKFNMWKSPLEISQLCHILCVPRLNFDTNHINIKKYNMTILKYNKSGEVSSSKLRKLQNLDLPIEVLNYIETHELYFIKLLKEKYYKRRRFYHVLSVAKLALQIAIENKIEYPYKAYIAGILHDIAKRKSDEYRLYIMKKHYNQYLNFNVKLYHQFVGAYMAEHIFDIKDEVILDAIKYHASGNENMNSIGMIVYSSDKIDPLRGHDTYHFIKECKKDFKKGFVDILKSNCDYLKKIDVKGDNELTVKCYKYYLGENYNE